MSRSRRPVSILGCMVFFILFSPYRLFSQTQEADAAGEGTTRTEKAIDISVPAIGINVDFGIPRRYSGLRGAYLGGGAEIQSKGLEVTAAGKGIVLFAQRTRLFSSGFPRSADNIIALAHENGFVTLYSSPSLSPADKREKSEVTKGETIGVVESARGNFDAEYYLRVVDSSSRLLVNPALFSPPMIDRAAPKIEELSLLKDGFRLKAEPERRVLQRLAQGEYRLAVRASDPSYSGGVVSGLFRIKVVLDGQVTADRKFDSARNLEDGLGFLGLSAPSSQLTDNEMRFLLGSRFLARGNHSLELTVYDFNGNAATLLWRFIVE